jgi:cystathionine beta-lyase family protein involved in aluminum resistance
MINFSDKLLDLTSQAERELADRFASVDQVAFENTRRVLDAFARHQVAESDFASTTGYGYDDQGREKLDAIYADVFHAEAAFVRHQIVNGTQALTIGLFGLLRPGDVLLSVTGKPYDTLEEVIGIQGKSGNGSLADFGVSYRQVDLSHDGSIDFQKIEENLTAEVKVVFIQRSKGYLNRRTLSVQEIGNIVDFVKKRSSAFVMVDNCYGEFTEVSEPTAVGADLIVGSLIKNPGGGMAECGGYLAGSAKAIELCSYRLTSVGVGLEVGASLGQNKNMYKGFFYAPHTVAQSLKTAMLAAYIFDKLGYSVEPGFSEERHDIIQAVKLGSEEAMCAFCKGIQMGSPVDAHVTPIPWAMPGYSDQVIMAAGTFTSGASIELSADGPIHPPYTIYFQGGLTYESGKIGILYAAEEILKLSSNGADFS